MIQKNTVRQARNIASPYTGDTVRPVIKEEIIGNKIRTVAVYTCPSTGNFITKTELDERDKDS